MTGLKDILRRRDRINEESTRRQNRIQVPAEFTFLRTSTGMEERIEPPAFPNDPQNLNDTIIGNRSYISPVEAGTSTAHPADEVDPALTADYQQQQQHQQENSLPPSDSGEKHENRLLQHFRDRSRSRSRSRDVSANLPSDLPGAPEAVAPVLSSKPFKTEIGASEELEAQWEKRATLLAKSNPLLGPAHAQQQLQLRQRDHGSQARSASPGISDAEGDITIQRAIALHESGDLERSSAMFAHLASPNGANNALAQVLWGLALRHGWGVDVDPETAIHYLSLAASNSALVEEAALNAGVRKGGAAKGELVLAIYELANCFRNGWGVDKDPVAARQYYETAANLGDADAMEEVSWCFLEGFGTAKDKFKAAQFLRLAEQTRGTKSVGNSWIWKPKYDSQTPPHRPSHSRNPSNSSNASRGSAGSSSNSRPTEDKGKKNLLSPAKNLLARRHSRDSSTG